jgi:hypothetical protein
MNVERKKEIITEIFNISKDQVLQDFTKISGLTADEFYKIKPLSRVGNNCVDYFTFPNRLETVGNKGINFWTLWNKKDEYMELPSIQTIIEYYRTERTKVNNAKMWYRIYNLIYGSIAIFRPLVAMNIYFKYKPQCILDFTMGWGGRLVGACACNVTKYIGIDLNMNLEKPYNDMIKTIKPLCVTDINLYFQDALTIDYSKMDYDMVLTSPPYYNLETYEGTERKSKEDWNELFYIPMITITWKHLNVGGHYCLNVNKEIYDNVCVHILGQANEFIPLIKRKRNENNNSKKYEEFIYVWFKTTRNENTSKLFNS